MLIYIIVRPNGYEERTILKIYETNRLSIHRSGTKVVTVSHRFFHTMYNSNSLFVQR